MPELFNWLKERKELVEKEKRGYPYRKQDLFKESLKDNKKLIRPRNIKKYDVCGVFAVQNERATDSLIEEFLEKNVGSLITYLQDPEQFQTAKTKFLKDGFRFVPTKDFFDYPGTYRPALRAYYFSQPNFSEVEFTIKDKALIGVCASDLHQWREDRCHWFISYLKEISLSLDAEFGWCGLFDHLMKFQGKDPRQKVFGMTFYGSGMVKDIGKDKLLSSPVYKAEELENGGIFLQLGEQPFYPHSEEYRNTVARHLGLEKTQEKKPVFPAWLRKGKAIEVEKPEETYLLLVAGLKAREIKIADTDHSLFDFFLEEVYETANLKSQEEFSFLKWFNSLGLELKAFPSGSLNRGRFDVHVGLPADEKERNLFLPQKELNSERLKEVVETASKLFQRYELKEEPELQIITYDGTGDF
jgi:hypothetical protein